MEPVQLGGGLFGAAVRVEGPDQGGDQPPGQGVQLARPRRPPAGRRRAARAAAPRSHSRGRGGGARSAARAAGRPASCGPAEPCGSVIARQDCSCRTVRSSIRARASCDSAGPFVLGEFGAQQRIQAARHRVLQPGAIVLVRSSPRRSEVVQGASGVGHRAAGERGGGVRVDEPGRVRGPAVRRTRAAAAAVSRTPAGRRGPAGRYQRRVWRRSCLAASATEAVGRAASQPPTMTSAAGWPPHASATASAAARVDGDAVTGTGACGQQRSRPPPCRVRRAVQGRTSGMPGQRPRGDGDDEAVRGCPAAASRPARRRAASSRSSRSPARAEGVAEHLGEFVLVGAGRHGIGAERGEQFAGGALGGYGRAAGTGEPGPQHSVGDSVRRPAVRTPRPARYGPEPRPARDRAAPGVR